MSDDFRKVLKHHSDWFEFAKRDDCLDRMVPSDLRIALIRSFRDGAQDERKRCLAILNKARNGDIDQDMRTIIHYVETGIDPDEVTARKWQQGNDDRARNQGG